MYVYVHIPFLLGEKGKLSVGVGVKTLLLWSSCTKQKTAAPHSSLVPRPVSLPGAIQAVTRSELLVGLPVRKDLPCKSVNKKEHVNVYRQLQCKACRL